MKTPRRYFDGGGFYLRVTTTGSRSWVFMATNCGKRQEIGVGAVTAVSFAAARQLATTMREAKALGHNPREAIAPTSPADVPAVPTFAMFAEEYISSIEAG